MNKNANDNEDDNNEKTTQKFGQLIVGPPGSGKTTYCLSMKNFYNKFKRKVLLINLDPANETTNITFDIDIRELINLDDIGNNLKLGPNGSFLYCFNFLEKNFDWLENKLKKFNDINYMLIDSPGQIEIFTLSQSFKNIIKKLTEPKELNIRLVCVNLIESINVCDMPKYIFSVLSVLNVMINLEMPQINFISKADLLKELKKNNNLPFDVEFFKNPSDCTQLNFYLDNMNVNPKFKKLNKKISELITDYSLVSFSLLDINNINHLNRASVLADKSNGYIYSSYMDENIDENIDSRCLVAQNDLENEELMDGEYEL